MAPTARPSTTPDPTQLTNQAVQTLTRAVRAIQSRPPQPTPESLQSLYTLCEAAVASGPQTCQLLYDRIKMEIERQAGEIRRVLTAAEASEGAEERWMGLCEEEGKRFLQQMLLVRSIFLQLDRTWVLQTPGVLSIWFVHASVPCGKSSSYGDERRDLAVDIFEHSVLHDHGEVVQSRIQQSLTQLVLRERFVATTSICPTRTTRLTLLLQTRQPGPAPSLPLLPPLPPHFLLSLLRLTLRSPNHEIDALFLPGRSAGGPRRTRLVGIPQAGLEAASGGGRALRISARRRVEG